ncbi:hypothetical protein JL09_g5519 [Pichia kudriavzevii]|uniref:Uncharacterized protein n=1 Tax=Pichia kudriavzevii TaxID=4909 RepID=A0A099NTX3_PICKU|nr:hypothetical protein JL09_g5519 [Pichia kudriavzevii]
MFLWIFVEIVQILSESPENLRKKCDSVDLEIHS